VLVELVDELTATADLRGNEYAWSCGDFPSVLLKARSLGYACLGGQFQFRLPDVTCEMYWLRVEPDGRIPAEPWLDFSARSCNQTLGIFNELVKTTDFEAEARRWSKVADLSADNTPLQRHLFFVAYFVAQ
jgi:hypothetical protein